MCECRVCKQSFVKNKKRVLETGRIYYADDKGRRWNGRACPGCFQKESNANLAERRVSRKYTPRPRNVKGHYKPRIDAASRDEFSQPAPKLRPCKKCGDSSINYFLCDPCGAYSRRKHPDLYEGSYNEEMFDLYSKPGTGAGFRY